jgi:drug/metabolite transporter (DMT)-like permease
MSCSPFARKDAFALILAAASWGLGTVISKRALVEIPPLTLLPIQLTASLLVLAVLMRRRGLSFRGGDTAPILGQLGLLNPGLAYSLSLLGLVSITASLSVLLWAIEPLLILVLAALLLRERITAAFVGLSLLAVAGMLLVILDPASSGQWTGIVLTLTGVACCATYTVIARRWLGTADSTVQVVASQQAYALAFSLVVLVAGWLLGGAVISATVTPAGWLRAVVSGVLYYAAAYWFYLTGLRAVPASVAAVSFYLIPVFGVAGGFVLLGERLDGRQWVGAAIVLVAVLKLIGRYQATSRDDRSKGSFVRPDP